MFKISAQVSVYPLGQANIEPTIDQVLATFRQHRLDITPGPMSTLVSGDNESVFAAAQAAFQTAASHGETVMVATFSNACPTATEDPKGDFTAIGIGNKAITYHPIGTVHNKFGESSQWEQMHTGESQIVLDPNLMAGLQGLAPGQQVMVLFYFDRVDDFELLQHPRGDLAQPKRGVSPSEARADPTPLV